MQIRGTNGQPVQSKPVVNLTSSGTPSPKSLSLVALEALPCGCVSSVYRARPNLLEMELLEAKGPHCLFAGHRLGHVVRLGLPEDIFDADHESSM